MFLLVSLFVVLATCNPITPGEKQTPALAALKALNITSPARKVSGNNITISSEGGSLPVISPNVLSENEAKIIEAESTKENKIKPRKGAPTSHEEETVKSELLGPKIPTSNINVTSNDVHSNTSSEKIISEPPHQLNNTKKTKTTADIKQKQLEVKVESNTTVSNTTVSKENKTEPKLSIKPLLLSYDALANESIKKSKESKLPASKASSKTLVADQIPSPHEKAPPKTIHVGAVGKSPDLVIPVVITILVVPVFAVLGYLAVKRGKEAWKNRHYKRMDFLLDGMYND